MAPEQITSRHDIRGESWLVDQWGNSHPVVSGTVIGRNAQACGIIALHSSVSSVHARIELQRSGTWRVVDLGSLNGIQVNAQAVRDSKLREGDILLVGEVGFCFTQRAPSSMEELSGPGWTVRTPLTNLPVRITLHCGEETIVLVRQAEGGVVEVGEGRVRLATLEYALVRALIERQLHAEDASDTFLSTRELIDKLSFRSRAADSENVRELVRRVRQKLSGLISTPLIESERGSGYKLLWTTAERAAGAGSTSHATVDAVAGVGMAREK
jgi:hypothetical protein